MKKSFRRQLTIIFSMVMAVTLLLILFGGMFFLENYYIYDKQKQVRDAYEKFNTAASENALDKYEFKESVREFSVTDNISVIVMGSDGRINLYATYDIDHLRFRLLDYIFDREKPETIKVIEETKQYILRQSMDRRVGQEYLEMIGKLDVGAYFIMRTPIESIQDSVAIANQFYVVLGTLAILLSAVIIYLFSRRVTKRVLELVEISQRMTSLDFDAKFESKGENEIDILGEHVNQLS